jgi:hypothetical protein
LNLRIAGEIDRAALASEKRKTPVNLVGAAIRATKGATIRSVIEAETCIPLTEDEPATPEAFVTEDYLLEYDSDGYSEYESALTNVSYA